MKYALTPVIIKDTENRMNIAAPAAGRYFGPRSSPATTQAPTTVPGFKKPTMKRHTANVAKFGEKALRKLMMTIPQRADTRTLNRPYLKLM